MTVTRLLVVFALGLPSFATLVSAAQNDLAQEYVQVRKIAMKDPKVRAAFDRANEKLEERILEIDPALRPFLNKHGGFQPKTSSRKALRRDVSPPARTGGATHAVTKGETLTSIAMRHKISVSRLKAANHLSSGAKLRVGQQLKIPPAHTTDASQDSWWTRATRIF